MVHLSSKPYKRVSPRQLHAYRAHWKGESGTYLYILARSPARARSAVYWAAKAAGHRPAYAECEAIRASYYDHFVSPFSKEGDIVGWEDAEIVTGCCSPDGTVRSREELA